MNDSRFPSYFYVGPEHLKRLRRSDDCICVTSGLDLRAWGDRRINGLREGLLAVTFIIDVNMRLWIDDRRSEHVACADGGPVLAAGEMIFSRTEAGVDVEEVTNQSTGFCPEPECWQVIAQVLDQLHIPRPSELTHAFVFRRCESCLAINLIKDEVFECDVCGRNLPLFWNFLPGKS